MCYNTRLPLYLQLFDLSILASPTYTVEARVASVHTMLEAMNSSTTRQQPPLLALPPEILNLITHFALTSSHAIVNPSPIESPKSPSPRHKDIKIRPKHHSIPTQALSTALLQTCKQLYHSTDIRSLYSSNTFIFTRAPHLSDFITSLPPGKRELITSITLSLIETSAFPVSNDGAPADPVVLEWLHYLTCPMHTQDLALETCCARWGSLLRDMPWLREVKVDIRGFRHVDPAEMATSGFKRGTAGALKQLMGSMKGLDVLEIQGHAGDLWDLVSVNRPVFQGEWYSIERWLTLVENALVGVLKDAVGETAWVGFCWSEERFGLCARKTAPTPSDLVKSGYTNACSWKQCWEVTRAKESWHHPVLTILEKGPPCPVLTAQMIQAWYYGG